MLLYYLKVRDVNGTYLDQRDLPFKKNSSVLSDEKIANYNGLLGDYLWPHSHSWAGSACNCHFSKFGYGMRNRVDFIPFAWDLGTLSCLDCA